MSKSKELLLECKIAAGIKTDYKLAKILEIHSGRIADYMNEKRTLDNYACMKIAILLKRDPAEIIATIEADTEKNEKRRTFWADFLQRAQQAGRVLTLGLIFIMSLQSVQEHRAGGFRRRLYFA